MSSLNRVHLIGRLGADPEIRQTKDNTTVANLSLATSEKWKDKSGEKQESTEWHKIVFFGRTAEVCEQYLSKGSLIYVEGKLQTNKWEDKDGHDRYTTEIRGFRMQMLGGKGVSSTKQEKGPQNANSGLDSDTDLDDLDDVEGNLPF